MRPMPRAAASYVAAVIALGIAVVALAIFFEPWSWQPLIVLAPLFMACDISLVSYLNSRVQFSISFPVALAAILLVGPWGAALVCATSVVDWHLPWKKRLFNGAQFALAGWFAGFVYTAVPGHAGPGFVDASFPLVLVPVLAAVAAHVLANVALTATVVRLAEGISMKAMWWGGLAEMAASYTGFSLIGLFMAVLWVVGVGPLAALLVLAPLLLARWAFQQFSEQHKAYERTVDSLIQAVEMKDLYTRGHSERVSKASVMIGHELSMREDRIAMLRHAGMLHDVGKLGVPTAVLQKTGPLDDEEFASIRLHPTLGLEMVGGISFLEEARKGIKHHHERMDGRGYPDGLSGQQIPEFARVIAVADAFDSMTSTRSYRGARSVEEAIEELRRWSGTQFDPPMVDALIAAVEKDGWEVTGVAPDDPVATQGPAARDHDDPTFAVRGPIPFVPRPDASAPASPPGGEAPELPQARVAT